MLPLQNSDAIYNRFRLFNLEVAEGVTEYSIVTIYLVQESEHDAIICFLFCP